MGKTYVHSVAVIVILKISKPKNRVHLCQKWLFSSKSSIARLQYDVVRLQRAIASLHRDITALHRGIVSLLRGKVSVT